MEIGRLVQDVFTWFGMRIVNRITVSFLPRNICMRIADGLGLISSLLPKGFQSFWMFKLAFDIDRWQALKLNARSHARLFRDNVIVHQVLSGKYDISKVDVKCTKIEKISEIIDSGESVILASLHFSREAAHPMYIFAKRLGHVSASILEKPEIEGGFADRMHCRRLLAQFGGMVDVLDGLTSDQFELLFVGPTQSPMKTLLRRLKAPGNIIITTIDAPWRSSGRGVLSRPFCGYPDRTFSTGTVKLAQVTGRPIILCIPTVTRNGEVQLIFGEPVRIERSDEAAESRVMNQLLDELEKYIATYPDQYVVPIGIGRRWNATANLWEDGSY